MCALQDQWEGCLLLQSLLPAKNSNCACFGEQGFLLLPNKITGLVVIIKSLSWIYCDLIAVHELVHQVNNLVSDSYAPGLSKDFMELLFHQLYRLDKSLCLTNHVHGCFCSSGIGLQSLYTLSSAEFLTYGLPKFVFHNDVLSNGAFVATVV